MRIFGRAVVLLSLMLYQLSAYGSQGYAYNAKIIGVDVRAGGVFLVAISPGISTPASCAASGTNRMTGNSTTPDGKALLAAALAAYLSGSPIYLVQGTGGCNEFPTYESLSILSQGVE